MQNQEEFIALDSVMCIIAALALTVFHPGWCFPQMAQPISFVKGKGLSTREDEIIGEEYRESVSKSAPWLDIEKANVMKPSDIYFR